MPAGQPWLKPDRNITPAVHRVEMVRRAIADNPHFKTCTLEVERPGPSYSVDTLMVLRKQLGNEASFFFILGRDTLADLPLWKEPAQLIQLCKLVVAPRPVLSEVEGQAHHPEPAEGSGFLFRYRDAAGGMSYGSAGNRTPNA